MADNRILPFALTDTGSNLLSQGDYEIDNDRFTGNQPGIARSMLVNKALRQSSTMAAGLAEFMARNASADAGDVTDAMTPAEVADYLGTVMAGLGSTGLPEGGEAGQALVIGEHGPEWRHVSGDPVGTIIAFAGKEAPKGFISISTDVETAVPVDAYTDLVKAVYCGDEANDEADFFYRAMNADGSVRHPDGGYLVLPAASKYFLRGRDATGQVAAYRYQGDAMQRVTGRVPYIRGNSLTAFTAYGSEPNMSGAFTSELLHESVNIPSGGTGGGYKGHGLVFDSSLSENVRTADENRPMNFPVLWCIKSWDVAVLPSELDVQALVNSWQGFADIVCGFEENDYFIFPPDAQGRRLIVQWCEGVEVVANKNAHTQTVTYPIAFPNRVFKVFCSNVYISGYGTHLNFIESSISNISVDIAGGNFSSTSGTFRPHILAIGY